MMPYGMGMPAGGGSGATSRSHGNDWTLPWVPCEQFGSSYSARISDSNGPYEDNADLAYWVKGDILGLAQGS
ncbi:hypothetical protein Pyn_40720 [Prunus yedoensis var. nudiflora]|uniref:Uncharacterized protein n=1 Tax=Prunus yedoensis var. nudiflora TaxID=2094558 RepID=A0A314ZER4_PRUYE|nr:hypothetical protein Pyn_40720 [Prunus yedoensis var. nudiflora]